MEATAAAPQQGVVAMLNGTTMETPVQQLQTPIAKASQKPSLASLEKPGTLASSEQLASQETPKKPASPATHLQQTNLKQEAIVPQADAYQTTAMQPPVQTPALAMPDITPADVVKMAMTPSEILASTLNELTQTMLVHTDETTGHLDEIRLILKPNVLDGTSILLKTNQNQLFVTFFPGTEEIAQLLMANQEKIAESIVASGRLPLQMSIISSEGRRQIRKNVA